MSDRVQTDDGWIKLCRRCSRHPDLRTFEEKGVWCDLLMLAASRSTTTMVNGVEVSLERGQLALVLTSWAAEHGINHRRLRAILAYFREKQMIDLATAKGKAGTIVTICNYGIYQSLYRADGHQERPLSDSTRKTIQEEESESYPNVESPTSNVEPYPVVVTRAPTREEAPGGADDGEVLASAVEAFCRDKRMETRGLSPHAARRYVDAVRPSYRAPGTLASAIRTALLPDQKNPVAVLLARASKFGVAVQVAAEEAAKPTTDPNLEALKRQLARTCQDHEHADLDPANRRLAHQAPAGA